MRTIYLVDDHEMILLGIKMAIQSLENCQVVGQATDGRRALDEILRLRPDILIIDLSLPSMNGFSVIRRLREAALPVKVVLFTTFCGDEQIREALSLKVDGYVLKEDSSAELLRALELIEKGYRYMAPRITTKLAEGLSAAAPDADDGLDALTPREREVLAQLVQGFRGKEICAGLAMSASTLKTHKIALMRKLKVRTSAELIALAARSDRLVLQPSLKA